MAQPLVLGLIETSELIPVQNPAPLAAPTTELAGWVFGGKLSCVQVVVGNRTQIYSTHPSPRHRWLLHLFGRVESCQLRWKHCPGHTSEEVAVRLVALFLTTFG
jgi:hypothetical protein